jgi:ADP-ribose pyrophosphatase YjhB (NUDIX family)
MYGKYQCPGGHIENESRYNAVIRELHEETNLIPNHTLEFKFKYSFDVQNDIYDNGNRIVYVYKMTTNQIPLNMEPEKHDDWILHAKKDLEILPIIDTLREYLSQYKIDLRILFGKMILTTPIFWNIVEISTEAIMKLRLINKNYDKFLSNWIRPYKISIFIYKRKTETLVMNQIGQRSTEFRTHSIVQQKTLQLEGGLYKVVQEIQIKANNIRLLYPDYYDWKALLYHNYRKIIGHDIITCNKEYVIKWHRKNINNNDDERGKMIIPIKLL